MSIFDMIDNNKSYNDKEYYEDDDYQEKFFKFSKPNSWVYSFLTSLIIVFLFSSFFLTQIDTIFGESKISKMLFKEDGEPTYYMNFFQLLLVFIIIKFISKW